MASATDTSSYRARLRTQIDDVEIVSTLLANLVDCVGTEFVDRDVGRHTDAEELRHDLGTVIAYFERTSREDAAAIRDDIEKMLSETDVADWEIVECGRYTDESWRESWKEFFDPLLLSERVAVGPPWQAEEIPVPSDGVGLVIDPGMAFGTGSHETTRLAAELLDEQLGTHDEPSVLDVGCGSAILSMAAAELGAAPVYGIDIEQDAIDAARANLQRNDLDGDVDVSTEPIDEVDRDWDIVVANILAHTLVDLGASLFRPVGPEGTLIVSGIPAERRDAFLDRFVPEDWEIEATGERGEWIAFVLRRE